MARHRAEMFRDMGILPEAAYGPLVTASLRYLDTAMRSGEYVGWLAAPDARPEEIVAGAGVQLREVLPHPDPDSGTLWTGPDALVVNVFTERGWRRHGLARLLMHHLIDWTRTNGIDRLVLHASKDGRPLYEELGFVATNEMRRTVGERERREEKGERR
jgi:GNAT superfamily N-acetyltransferase